MQARWTCVGIVAGLAAIGCAAFAARDTAPQTVDAIAEALFATGATPGMAIVVVRGDSTVYAQGFGWADRAAKRPVTPETPFYIASTTKALTALAVALLAHRGALDLDAPLSTLLPAARLHATLDPSTITLRDLLTHTHGISNDGPVVLRTAYTGDLAGGQLVSLLVDHPADSSGRAFNYGNIGYNVAGFLLDARAPGGWKRVVEAEVIEPLGMRRTSAYRSTLDDTLLARPYQATPDDFGAVRNEKTDATMHAAGGHFASASDLARLLRAFVNDGIVDDRRVFPAEVVRETRRKQADQKRTFGEIERFGWGLGWDLGTVNGDTLVHRFGTFAGFRSHVSYMPRHRLGVVVLVNGGGFASSMADAVALSIYDRLSNAPGADGRIADRIEAQRARAMRGRQSLAEERAKRAARDQRLPHPLEAYAGTYESPLYGRQSWRVIDGRLEVRFGAASSAAEVFDGPSNQLRVELTGGGSVARFVFPAEAARAASLDYDGVTYQRVTDER